MLRFSGFFFERTHRAFIPEGGSSLDKLTVSRLAAYFVISLASYVGTQHVRVVDELLIVACLYRKLVLKSAACPDFPEPKWINGAVPNLPVDPSPEKKNGLSISPSLLDHFFEDFFPLFLNEAKRY